MLTELRSRELAQHLATADAQSAKQFLELTKEMQAHVLALLIENHGAQKACELFEQIAKLHPLEIAAGKETQVLLASQSPRRKYLLGNVLGVAHNAKDSSSQEFKPSYHLNSQTVTQTKKPSYCTRNSEVRCAVNWRHRSAIVPTCLWYIRRVLRRCLCTWQSTPHRREHTQEKAEQLLWCPMVRRYWVWEILAHSGHFRSWKGSA
jgi:hypothetical protein